MNSLLYVLELARMSVSGTEPTRIVKTSILYASADYCLDVGLISGIYSDGAVVIEGLTKAGAVVVTQLEAGHVRNADDGPASEALRCPPAHIDPFVARRLVLQLH